MYACMLYACKYVYLIYLVFCGPSRMSNVSFPGCVEFKKDISVCTRGRTCATVYTSFDIPVSKLQLAVKNSF